MAFRGNRTTFSSGQLVSDHPPPSDDNYQKLDTVFLKTKQRTPDV